jgi:hypothetical protein
MVEYNWLIFFVIYSRIMDFVEKINGTYSIVRGCHGCDRKSNYLCNQCLSPLKL